MATTDRRRFLQGVAGIVGAGVAGCSEDGESGDTAATGTTGGTDSPEASPTLTPSATLRPTPAGTVRSTPTGTSLPQSAPGETASPTRTVTAPQTMPGASSKLVPADGDPEDLFGVSAGLDNETAIIGAHRDEDPNGEGAGAVYVFERASGTWTQQAKLAATDGDHGDSFGTSVTLAGDTAVIGAPMDEDPHGDRGGAAYVFQRSNTEWSQHAKLAPDDGESRDTFGQAVALSGRTALIAAPGEEVFTGSAYLFTQSNGTWRQQAKLTASDGDDQDFFGMSVALANETALIGAPGTKDGMGSAYVFKRTSGGWTQQSTLTAPDGDSKDQFGGSVTLAADTALVGAPTDEDPNGDYAGSAYVFRRTTDGWGHETKIAAEDGDAMDSFGQSVALADKTALVGAASTGTAGDEDPNGEGAGSAYLFERVDGTWGQEAKLAPADGDSRDMFGTSAAMTGETAIIGALADEDPNGDDAGAVYVFDR